MAEEKQSAVPAPEPARAVSVELERYYSTMRVAACVAVFCFLLSFVTKLGYRQFGDQPPWFVSVLDVFTLAAVLLFGYAFWSALTLRFDWLARAQQWSLDRIVDGARGAVAWSRRRREQDDDGLTVIDEPDPVEGEQAPDDEEDFQLELPADGGEQARADESD